MAIINILLTIIIMAIFGTIKKGLSALGQKLGVLKKPSSNPKLGNKKTPTVETMSSQHKMDALMAKAAYDKPKDRKSFGPFIYDKGLSNLRTAVWHAPGIKQTVIAYKGTNDFQDLISDIDIVKGTTAEGAVFKQDKIEYDKIKAKYGSRIRVVGHSLGAARSRETVKNNAADNPQLTGHGFNVGEGANAEGLGARIACSNPIKAMRPKFCDKFESSHIKGDPLSSAHRVTGWGRQTNYAGVAMPGSIANHDMTNFIK